MQPIKDPFTHLQAYNKQIKIGSYVYSYVSGRDSYPIICQVKAIEGIYYRLKNVKTGRTLVRQPALLAYLPGFAELPDTHPELLI